MDRSWLMARENIELQIDGILIENILKFHQEVNI
jgi:hypothetical protein